MSAYIGGLPARAVVIANNLFTAIWQSWFSTAQVILQDVGNSGPTSGRPTTNLYPGKIYFDTSLGYPVWLKSAGPPAVWVNATGATV